MSIFIFLISTSVECLKCRINKTCIEGWGVTVVLCVSMVCYKTYNLHLTYTTQTANYYNIKSPYLWHFTCFGPTSSIYFKHLTTSYYAARINTIPNCILIIVKLKLKRKCTFPHCIGTMCEIVKYRLTIDPLAVSNSWKARYWSTED